MLRSCHNHKLLVLGAGGKVGRMLAAFWQACPPARIVPVLQTSSQISPTAPDGYMHWRADGEVSKLPEAQTIVALWGVTPGADQDMRKNVGLGLRSLDIATQMGADRLLLASSSAVYSGAGPGRHAEADALPAPKGAYGASKLEMERAVEERRGAGHGPAVSMLRLANVIGADSLFGSLRPGGTVTLDRFTSGSGPLRSYLAVEDLARVLEVLATCPEQALPPIVNVAGTEALAMADLVDHAGGKVAWRAAPQTALERVEMDTQVLQGVAGRLEHSSDPAQAIASWRRLRGRA